MTECDICKNGIDYKNIGAHRRFKHKSKSSDPAGTISKSLEATIISPIKTIDPLPADDNHKESVKEIAKEYVKEGNFFARLFKRKKPEIIEKKQVTVEEMLTKMPKWAIKEHKPWFSGETKNKRLIQFVGVSKIKPPVMCWLYWDGVFISMEDGLYQPPHDIRGDVFFYDLDNSRPLLDNLKADDETHESLRMAQVGNIKYAMGRIAGAKDLLKNLGLILLGIGFLVLLCLANLYFSYQMTQGLSQANSQIGNITTAVNNFVLTHP